MVLIIPLVLDIFPEFKIEIKILVITLFFILNIIFSYFDITAYTLKINLETLLELMVMSMYGKKHNHYRSNIMLYSWWKRTLKIFYSYNMGGHHDRNFEIRLDDQNHADLCASSAYNTGDYICLKCRDVPAHNQLVNQHRIWEEMKSVASVPIRNKRRNKIIGILNIDSEYSLRTTQFKKPTKYILLNYYSDIITNAIG